MTTDDKGAVQLERVGECALLVLDRPARLNTLTAAMLDELAAALVDVARSTARALLVTGAGPRAFCAGADLHESRGRTPAAHRASVQRGQEVFNLLGELSIPSVALVNGLALGGGLELALACDFRLCRGDALLGCPEVKVGLLPGYGGTQRLPRLVGPAVALEMILSGEPVDAARAREIGLVNEVVDGDLLDTGRAFAARFTRHSLVAVRLARDAVRAAATSSLADGLRAESELSTVAYGSQDASEGIAAFVAKRAPHFQDR